MPDATVEFFQKLEARGHEPLLEKANGSVRFDLTKGKRKATWRVAIVKGDVTVSRERSAADCVARLDTSLFEAILRGEMNATAALLRGAIGVEGDTELLVLFQRLFPGPPQARRKAGYARRRS